MHKLLDLLEFLGLVSLVLQALLHARECMLVRVLLGLHLARQVVFHRIYLLFQNRVVVVQRNVPCRRH